MSYDAVFITLYSRQRTPGAARHPPIDALQQHRQLRRTHAHLTLCWRRPHESSPAQAACRISRPLTIPPDHLDQITTATSEHKQMPAKRVLRQNLFSQNRQAVEPLAHVGLACGKPNFGVTRDRVARQATAQADTESRRQGHLSPRAGARWQR